MRAVSRAIVAGLVLGVVVSAGAKGAEPGFCDQYAHAAVRQIELAEHKCDYTPNFENGRWSGGYRHHYDWCLGVSYRDADDERQARRISLDRCGRR